MPKRKREVEGLAQLFRVLGDPTRLALLLRLKEGQSNVTSLCDALRMPQPTVSRHLGILRMAGLVNHRRRGKEIIYSLASPSRNGKVFGAVLRAVERN